MEMEALNLSALSIFIKFMSLKQPIASVMSLEMSDGPDLSTYVYMQQLRNISLLDHFI